MTYNFFASAAIFAGLLSVTGHLVNTNVPDPYMDEIFHIPQVQKYCQKNFTHWDPKITTLPGLYLFSVGLIQPLNSIPSLFFKDQVDIHQTCSTQNLRSLNILLGLVNLSLIHCLTTQLHGEKQGFSENLSIWSSMTISLLPVLFMFNFLYYTDTLSTGLILLTYSLHLADKDLLASLSGACAVLCRQTNIVWVFLTAALTGGNTLVAELRQHQARTKNPPTIALTTVGQIKELGQGVAELLKSPVRLARLVGLILVKCSGYVAVGVIFLLFIKWNKGIVVGDRSAHVAVIHTPQVMYFLCFTAALSWPYYILRSQSNSSTNNQTNPVWEFFQWLKGNFVCATLLLCAILCCVHFNTMAHPYLLADNRHFTFYLWRKILNRHVAVKYILGPVYLFCGWAFFNQIIGKSSLMFKLLFPVCTVLCLVPQQLLELRYFIIPYILARLQVKPVSGVKIFLEFATAIGINLAVFYLFLFKPFTWENAPHELQRFMW